MVKVELFDIIATIESNTNFHAMRFEPSIYKKISENIMVSPIQAKIIDDISHINKCTISTADIIYSTSWGAVQLMGFNIYNGYDKSIYDFLSSEQDQRKLFTDFVTRKGINFPVDILANHNENRKLFARYYNGPGNIDAYSSLIVASLKQHGFTVC